MCDGHARPREQNIARIRHARVTQPSGFVARPVAKFVESGKGDICRDSRSRRLQGYPAIKAGRFAIPCRESAAYGLGVRAVRSRRDCAILSLGRPPQYQAAFYFVDPNFILAIINLKYRGERL